MQQLTVKQLNHYLLRAGFGANAAKVQALAGKPIADIVKAQLEKAKAQKPIEVTTLADYAEFIKPDTEDKGNRKEMLKAEFEKAQTLNLTWIDRMITGEDYLNEKMTLFWHDHFACKEKFVLLAQQLNNSIRKHALTDFRSLLMAVIQEPAMLKYLNNNQNKKDAPNENFARELLELFTLGRGNYTEDDVRGAAAAFTGWTFQRSNMAFFFNPKQHNYEDKVFMGVIDKLDGTNIIDIILNQKQCAIFITEKIYRHFVNPVPDKAIVNELADYFFANKYNIASLMEKIFTSDWFYSEQHIGVRIKSPVELITGLSRQLQITYPNPKTLLLAERLMGQVLFKPPNVAGWPEDKDWIDSSSLLFRMSLGKKLVNAAVVEQAPKGDDDDNPNMTLAEDTRQNSISAVINWAELAKAFKQAEDEKLFDEIAGILLQAGKVSYSAFKPLMPGGSKEDKVKAIATYLISTPEYQLC